jgi:NAD dependent epimerase/dehydratase family enzyme
MGIVLGRDEGAFPELAKYTKWFLGGAQGDGRHWMSWIHIADVAGAYQWAIESDWEGPFNLVSPNPIRNADFMACLRKTMHRPWSPPAPAFAIRLVGALRNLQTDVVLESQRAVPAALESRAFAFKYPDLKQALADLAGGDT